MILSFSDTIPNPGMFISHLQSFFGSSVDYGGMFVTKNGNMTNEPLFGVIKGTLPGRPLRTPIRNVTRCSMQSSPRHSPHIAAPIFRFFTPEPRNDDLLLERLAELRRAQPGVRAQLREGCRNGKISLRGGSSSVESAINQAGWAPLR